MKILMVSYAALPEIKSGVSNVIFNISKELSENNHKIFTFCMTNDKAKVNNDGYYDGKIEFYSYRSCINYNKSGTVDKLNCLNKDIEQAFIDYIQVIEPDVVHFHAMQIIGVNLIEIAKKMNIRTILTMHDWWWICPEFFMTDKKGIQCNQIKISSIKCKQCYDVELLLERNNYLKKILINYVDEILCVSKYLENFIRKNFPEISNKISVNVNGVKKTNIRVRQGLLYEDKITFGFVGGLNREKGFDIIQEAFLGINPEKYKLLIFGVTAISAKEYSMKIKNIFMENKSIKKIFSILLSKVKKLLKIHSLNKINIDYLKPYKVDEIESVFSKFDVLIISSIVLESFSLVAREALINGCVVITSKCGGPEEVIVNDINGLVTECGNVEQLRKVILDFINDKLHVKKLQDNINTTINTIDDINNQIDYLEKIYQNI